MPMTRASVVSQFKISLSKTPDYYANKVWDIGRGHGIDNRGSQCWPFYLESYTAYTAMQAGYYDDAMEIMRHIQLVNLRRGWSWCQNLWNPAELTYMTAPVVWFSTDVLAGAGLNVPAQELRLAPVVQGCEKAVMPLYYPGFWARLTVDPARRKIGLRIIKTFGERRITLSRIVSEHYGVPAEDRTVIPITPFTIREGAELDLSAHYGKIVQTRTERAVPDRRGRRDRSRTGRAGRRLTPAKRIAGNESRTPDNEDTSLRLSGVPLSGIMIRRISTIHTLPSAASLSFL